MIRILKARRALAMPVGRVHLLVAPRLRREIGKLISDKGLQRLGFIKEPQSDILDFTKHQEEAVHKVAREGYR